MEGFCPLRCLEVVLNQTDYVAKMENLLDDDAYKKVKHGPTSKTETRISTALKECEPNHQTKPVPCSPILFSTTD